MKTVELVSKQRVALDVCVVRVIVEKRVQVIPKKYVWRIVVDRSPENTRWDFLMLKDRILLLYKEFYQGYLLSVSAWAISDLVVFWFMWYALLTREISPEVKKISLKPSSEYTPRYQSWCEKWIIQTPNVFLKRAAKSMNIIRERLESLWPKIYKYVCVQCIWSQQTLLELELFTTHAFLSFLTYMINILICISSAA